MQQYFLKKQSEDLFLANKLKQEIFKIGQDLQREFSFIQQNQNSKFKIPKVNTQQAKSIFLELNKKNSVKQPSSKKNWKFEETSLLIYLVDKFLSLEKAQDLTQLSCHIWDQISEFLPGRSPQDCKYKVLSLTASTITNIPWSFEQRNILTEIIEEEGMNWNVVSQRLYEMSDKKVFRTSKQCRQHYMCFLKPNLKKGAWTEQQDYRLVCLFLEYGRKWSKIMKFIEGRNQNSIKNRFFLLFQNKGKTSNHSDLLRKVKRKRQRMEKGLKDTMHNFKVSIEEKSLEQINSEKTWEKVSEMEMEKQAIQPETKKGDDMQLSEYLLKYEEVQPHSRKDLHECIHSRNRLSLNNFQSYQHLDFSQLDIGPKNASSIEAFQSFEQYICF